MTVLAGLQKYNIQQIRVYRSRFMSATVYSFSVISTAANIQSCATPAIGNLSNAYLKLLDLRDQAAQAVQDAASVGFFNILPFITSRGLQIASSVPAVMAQLAIAVPAATAQIPICGATVAATAGQQLSSILANVQSCVNQSG